MQVDGIFPLFNYEIGSLSSHYLLYQVIATANSSIAFLACALIFYITRITQMSLRDDLIAH